MRLTRGHVLAVYPSARHPSPKVRPLFDLSSDCYLRLTADGGKMLRKEIALTNARPTSPM